jgi:hypothetical protein
MIETTNEHKRGDARRNPYKRDGENERESSCSSPSIDGLRRVVACPDCRHTTVSGGRKVPNDCVSGCPEGIRPSHPDVGRHTWAEHGNEARR